MTAFMCSSPHPYSTLISGVFPLHQITHVGVSERISLKLFGCEIYFRRIPCNITALCVASRGKLLKSRPIYYVGHSIYIGHSSSSISLSAKGKWGLYNFGFISEGSTDVAYQKTNRRSKTGSLIETSVFISDFMIKITLLIMPLPADISWTERNLDLDR